MSNARVEYSALDLPKLVSFETCEFPVVEDVVGGYKVLQLPQSLRRVFDEEDASVVRINSTEVANAIPDFGGRSSGDNFSLLPHQDHLDPTGDRRRFLMLSKRWDGARGSKTLIMMPSVADRVLPHVESWIKDAARRKRIGAERSYDVRFLITREQYDSCFDDENGYEAAVSALAGNEPGTEVRRAVRLGILGYLMRGATADEVMREVVSTCNGMILEERWDRGGVVIIDNRRVFHARLGGNTPPLQRNFCT